MERNSAGETESSESVLDCHPAQSGDKTLSSEYEKEPSTVRNDGLSLDDSGHRRSKALYYGKGQVPEMAFRDGRYADNFGGAIRDYDDICQIKRRQKMLFETMGSKENPAVLFFHAMGVTGASRAANLSQNIFAKNISAFCQP